MIWRFKFVFYIYILKPLPHEPNRSLFKSTRSLRASNRIGWVHAIVFHATATCAAGVDKASFHATRLNRGGDEKQPLGSKMKIKIGSNNFTAILYENKTAGALKAMLPLTLTMSELNGNEKYFQLSTNLPTNTENIGTIQEGDF